MTVSRRAALVAAVTAGSAIAAGVRELFQVAGGTYVSRGVPMFQIRGDWIEDFSEHFDTAAFLRTFA